MSMTDAPPQNPENPEQPQETPQPSSTLRDDALSSFAQEAEEDQETEVSRNPDLDDVLKDVPERTWKVSGVLYGQRRQGRQVVDVKEKFEREYVQKPLSYLGMMQFTGLLGRKIDEIMSGPEGLSVGAVNDVMAFQQMVERDEDGKISFDLSQADFSGIDAFVRGFAKMMAYTPDIIAEAQCIWLRVPLRERLAVMEIWGRPIDEGGLTMDEFEEMLDIFIHQNYEELERFLVARVRRLANRVAKERARLHPVED